MSVDKDKVNLFTMYGVKMRDKTFDQDIKVNIYASNLDGAFIKEGLTRASGLSSKVYFPIGDQYTKPGN